MSIFEDLSESIYVKGAFEAKLTQLTKREQPRWLQILPVVTSILSHFPPDEKDWAIEASGGNATAQVFASPKGIFCESLQSEDLFVSQLDLPTPFLVSLVTYISASGLIHRRTLLLSSLAYLLHEPWYDCRRFRGRRF